MQRSVDRQPIRLIFEQSLPWVGGRQCAGRGAYVPVRALEQRFTPGRKAGLAGVDLLTTADQCDDHGPIRVATHNIEKHRRFTFCVAKLPAAEIGIPGALRLVKHDHMLVRRFVPFANCPAGNR